VSVVRGTIVSQTAGKVVFDYTGGDTKPNVYLNFSGLDPAHPVSDVHLVRADQQNLFQAGEIFNPDFIAKVSQWGVVRFMDWGSTNTSGAVDWTTRTTLDDQSWTSYAHNDGVPLEAMVKLANEAHVDMWYNVPTKADDTFVTNALTYIRDHLDPGLKVHVEWSNEVWNSGFAANAYAQGQANALWGNGTTVANGANIYYGYRSAQVANIAHQVFTGTHAGQLVDVLSGQAAKSGLVTYMLQGIDKAGLGSAASLFHDYAVAPYFGSELSNAGLHSADRTTVLGWANSGAAGLDAAFHELQYGGSLNYDVSLAAVDKWLTSSAAAAKSAGLNLVTYEAGAALYTSTYSSADRATVEHFFGKLMNDPRMGDLYAKLVSDFKAAGGTDFLAFNDISGNSTSGYYGVLDSVYDSHSPRYDALIAAAKADMTSSSVATMGPDNLFATAGGGTISALAGDDTITAGTGNDTLDGGDGNDNIVGSSGTTNAMGYLVEADYYSGGAGSDTIVGGVGNDHIYGNESTSAAGAPDGADSLFGGAGSDDIYGNAGNDTIDGGNGNDALYGGDGDDKIMGGAGNDYLQGNTGNDLLSGGAGNDGLHGGSGNDTLSGDDGNDTLYGDTGYDVLTGGAGQDQFVFGAGKATFATSGASAYATDEITDFTPGTDKIALGFHPVELLHGSSASLSDAAAWATQALQGHSGVADVAAVTVGSDTYLFYNDAGTGGALNSAIHLDHVTDGALALTDFV
jgi:Ca2+-binding RTX toxin-like protein